MCTDELYIQQLRHNEGLHARPWLATLLKESAQILSILIRSVDALCWVWSVVLLWFASSFASDCLLSSFGGSLLSHRNVVSPLFADVIQSLHGTRKGSINFVCSLWNARANVCGNVVALNSAQRICFNVESMTDYFGSTYIHFSRNFTICPEKRDLSAKTVTRIIKNVLTYNCSYLRESFSQSCSWKHL